MMRALRRLWRWLRWHREVAALREELETHRSLVRARLESRGLPPAEADAASHRAMGNVGLAREDARDVWIAAGPQRVWRDVRHGARALRREPTFALTAVLTMALGVATTTTVFSVVDAEIWKPLAFPHPDRLVEIYSQGPGTHSPYDILSGTDWLDWRAEARSFEDIAAVGRTRRRVLRRDTAESVLTTTITSNYFSTLGRRVALGRAFTVADEPGGHAAVISDAGWRRLFGADPALLGRSVLLDGNQATIVGVLAPINPLGADPDVYLVIDPASPDFRDRRNRSVTNVIGRLRRGIEAPAAQAELQTIASRIARAFPEGRASHAVHLMDLREYYTGYDWRPLYFFLGASLVLLLLSSINVATLVLARALRRAREFAIRGALGAGRRALGGLLLAEGALLAVPGGAAGIVLTTWALAFFTSRIPADYLERGAHIPVDARVLAFAMLVTGLTAIVFGLVPLLFARRIDLNLTLGDRGRTATASPAHSRTGRVLLIAQVALTVVLLATAGLLVRSYVGLAGVPPGFDPADRATVHVSLSGPRYQSDDDVRAYARQAVESATAVPGVLEAAVTSSSPLDSGPLVRVVAADRPRPPVGDETHAIIRSAGPGYFRTLAIPILRGHSFTAEDANGAPRVAIVNEHLARTMFPGEDPVGRAIELLPGQRTPWTERPGRLTVVGVAANVKQVALNETEFSDVTLPFAQAPAPGFDVVIRSAGAIGSVIASVRAAVAVVDPDLPITSVRSFDQRVDEALQGDRFNLLLVGWFAAVAAVIAGVGIYGALACSVQDRTREFGVRLALGARPRTIVVSALTQAARLGVLGGVLGLGAAISIAGVIGSALYLVPGQHEGLLYGVRTTDPVALACAFLGIVMVALAAGAIPAARIGCLDPVLALRHE